MRNRKQAGSTNLVARSCKVDWLRSIWGRSQTTFLKCTDWLRSISDNLWKWTDSDRSEVDLRTHLEVDWLRSQTTFGSGLTQIDLRPSLEVDWLRSIWKGSVTRPLKVHITSMGILNICHLWILLRKIVIYLVRRKCHLLCNPCPWHFRPTRYITIFLRRIQRLQIFKIPIDVICTLSMWDNKSYSILYHPANPPFRIDNLDYSFSYYSNYLYGSLYVTAYVNLKNTDLALPFCAQELLWRRRHIQQGKYFILQGYNGSIAQHVLSPRIQDYP